MVGICAMVAQGAGIGPIVRRLGERRTLTLGLGSGAAGFLIFGMAPTGTLFWLGMPLRALWGVSGAALQSLNTQRVESDQQGQLQGATSSVQSVSQLVGPFPFTLTFAYFIGADAPVHLPGAAFLLAAALMLLSVLIACGGIWLAYRWYIQHPEVPGKIAAASPFLYKLIYNKYYVDQIYDAMFVNRIKDLALTLGAFDLNFINGLGVDGTGWATRITSRISAIWDSWIVDGLVNLAARIVWLFSWPVRMLQTGRVARYALFMLFGVLIFLGYYLWTSGFRL